MAERVRRVVRQTKARVFVVFDGVTQFRGKLVSLFEPQTECAAEFPLRVLAMSGGG
jgi:hypothetical protein